MNDVLLSDKKLENLAIRKQIIDFESELKEHEGAFVGDSEHCPLKHSFGEGIYVREIFIPKGTYIVGKLHKHEHPNFLMSGDVDVVTESGKIRLKAPCSMISSAGTKRALYAITDLIWITVHLNPTNTQDLEELEKEIIADSYEEYERFKKLESNKFIMLYKKIIKKLIW
jgi:hypothetical protein